MKRKLVRACTVAGSLGFVQAILPKLAQRYDVLLLSSPGKKLDTLSAQYGVRGTGIPMQRRISLLKDIYSLWLLILLFWREKPYAVHSMTPKAGMLCMLAAWITRVPIRIHTFTGLIFPTSTGIKRQILILTDRITCACATHINPEGYGVLNDLKHNNITRKPMCVLGYGNVKGVDMTYFNISDSVKKESKGIKENYSLKGFTFIFVGRICKEKGIDELIAAYEKLQEEYECNLILVGSYESKTDPISLRTEKEIETNLSIHAVGPQSDVRPWYAAADCLVFPSYREGFPNVVLEAGAMGLPSIVTDINGSREIIENGKNGLIIPSHNVDELYAAMCRIVNDSKLRAKLSSNSREMIESRFEQSYVQQNLLNWYDVIIK